MNERLQRGREKPSPTPRPAVRAADDWSESDYEDHGTFATLGHKYLLRRRVTKARVAAMTRKRRVLRRSMIAGTWFLGFIAAFMILVIIAYESFTDVPRPEDLPLAQTATIEYSDGSTLAKIGSVDRTIVKLDQVPPTVKWAVLAAEDRGFYAHGAVSLTSTVRAAMSDVTGGDTQGGSGITQQYVKNAYLNNAQTISRKIKELMIAVKLSREYSKDQILEFYLNTVYFGRGAYGIQAAAHAYFNLDVSKLDTAQGALLAALLRAPSYYDPAVNPNESMQRWKYVLDGMVATGHLTTQQESAQVFPTTRKQRNSGLGVDGWKYLLEKAVLAELAANGISSSEIIDRGLVIRTTIDKKAQSAALHAIKTTYAHLTKKQRNIKNSLVAIDPKTGGVLAYYGGTGPGVKGNDGTIDFNDWAQQRANPPGSSFKPYVLAALLEQTVKQGSDDTKIHYAISSKVDGSFCRKIQGTQICNDPGDKDVSGPSVTIDHAMRYSLNTTFDELAVEADPAQVAATAHAMGVAALDSAGNKTLVDSHGQTDFGIGIGDYPATVLDQASGYATLADGGVHNKAYLVTQARASDGGVVYQHTAAPKPVLDPRVANDVTLTLEDVAADAGDGLADGRMSAAKTGTEGISAKSLNNSDAWMVGYTPQVSAAVWTGTGKRVPIYNSAGQPEYGKDLSATAWKSFMDDYLQGMPKLKLASRQLISDKGTTLPPPPKVTYTPPPTTKAPSSTPPTTPKSTPESTPSLKPPPSSYTPPPVPSDTVAPPTSSANCGTLLTPPCPSASP